MTTESKSLSSVNTEDLYTTTCGHCGASFEGTLLMANVQAINHHELHARHLRLEYVVGRPEKCDAIKPGQTLRCELNRGHSGRHGINW